MAATSNDACQLEALTATPGGNAYAVSGGASESQSLMAGEQQKNNDNGGNEQLAAGLAFKPAAMKKRQYVFGDVAEAMESIRVTGDDVSEQLHELLNDLDNLDDAMDDWDADNVGEERGEAYNDLLPDGGAQSSGLPLHHTTAGSLSRRSSGNSRRGDGRGNHSR